MAPKALPLVGAAIVLAIVSLWLVWANTDEQAELYRRLSETQSRSPRDGLWK